MSGIKTQLVLAMVLTIGGAAAGAYIYDANDFAAQVIQYIEGDGVGTDSIDFQPFNNPANALGRPTVDTTGDNHNIATNTNVPVVIVYPAFRSFEIVSIGDGGRLIVKFNHPVGGDENNPHGIDFIVFGNAQQKSGIGMDYRGWLKMGYRATFMVNSSELIGADQAIVSVSQDGINWYSYTNGPYADDFPPTFGRIYDPNHPDTSIGTWNLWWGHPTDPTVPLDPALTANDFKYKSVSQISQMYGESAGGAGYDLSETGMEWIEYVKIVSSGGAPPEIDAVADVSCCGDWKHPFASGDITHNCRVDYEDLAEMADWWLHQVTGPNDPAATADIYEDGIINFKDFAMVAHDWLECNWECE